MIVVLALELAWIRRLGFQRFLKDAGMRQKDNLKELELIRKAKEKNRVTGFFETLEKSNTENGEYMAWSSLMMELLSPIIVLVIS